MTAATQDTARRALAHLLAALRPDWDPPGIAAELDTLHRDRQPLGNVARAAVDAALTPSTKTPAGITARLRGGFTGAEPVERPTPTPPKLITCKRCGAYVTEPWADHEADCARRATETTYARGAAAAKQALAAARSGVGNSSGDQESTHTVEGAQNGAQSLPGASQPNRNPQEPR